MKEKINSLLLEAWSSVVGGIDTSKATDSIYTYFQQKIDEVTDSCERQLEEQYQENKRLGYLIDDLEDIIEDREERNQDLIDEVSKLEDYLEDLESFEEDMEASDKLMQDSLPFLHSYRLIHSNNPNLYKELGNLIFKIEKQIIKNGK